MNKRYFVFVVLFLAFFGASAQMRSVSITPPNATILPGESVSMTATGASFYLWSPATALSTTIGPVTVATPAVTTTYTCTGYEPGPESVVNGNFEQGNVGFTSAYEYNSNVYNEGTYFVDSDASLHHESFVGHGHGGSGNFMIINGATYPGTNVWTEQIAVRPNTYYAFSTWVCTLHVGNEALLQFSINGQQIGNVFSAPANVNVWQQFYQIWYSGNNTSASITILNQNTNGSGNDFGLDDISFCELVYDSEARCTITVDALVAIDDNASTCQGTSVEISVLPNDHLIQGCNSPTITIVQNASHGTAVLLGELIRYTPQGGFSGDDSFCYRISCSGQNATATVRVQVIATPDPTITAEPQAAIYGGAVTLTAHPNANGTFHYQWSPADKVLDATAATTTTVSLFENTTFSVAVTNDQGECQGNEEIVVAIEGSAMTATATADDTEICQNDSTRLHARPVGGTGNYTYRWSPANSLSDATSQNPVAWPPIGTTTYSCEINDGYSAQTANVSIVVHPNVQVERALTLCSNDSVFFFGFGYVHQPGIYIHEALTEYGCDSISTLILSQNTAYDYSLPDVKICEGGSFVFGNQEITASGDYICPGTTIDGCDSIVHLRVDISDHDEVFYDVNQEEPNNTCDQYYWDPKGKEFVGEQGLFLMQSGDYQRVYQNVGGCDSIVNLHVDLDYGPQPSEIVPESHTNVAPHWVIPATEFQVNSYDYKLWETGMANWDSVSWSIDNTNWLIEPYGDMNSYCRVYVTETMNDTIWLKARVFNRCANGEGIERKYWLVSSFYGSNENQIELLGIYPNPTNGLLTIEAVGMESVAIVDVLGQVLERRMVNDDQAVLDFGRLKPAVYFVEITTAYGIVTKRVVVCE